MSTVFSKMRLISLLAFTALSITFTSCSRDNDSPETQPPSTKNKEHFIIMTADNSAPGIPGYLTAYADLPKGEIATNIVDGSLNTQGSGFYIFGKYVFQRMRSSRDNASITDGIQRYSINDAGKLVKDGFISASNASMYIYSYDTGFYLDSDKGLMKLQVFNPTTMQRTGEIDLSEIRDTNFEYQSVGENLIVAKGNKLYAGVTYGSMAGRGSFFKDPALGYVDMAVIDIPTRKFEKKIRTNKVSYLGYPGNHNQMWTLGDDGALYFCSHGFSPSGAKGSSIVRIKKDATEFDANWILNADNTTPGSTLGSVAVKDGKLYTAIGSEAINFKTIATAAIYDYYAFDVNNPAAGGKKLPGMEPTRYAFQNGHGIVNINNQLFFNVNNSQTKGYYKLEGDKLVKVFTVKKGGDIMGFNHVVEK